MKVDLLNKLCGLLASDKVKGHFYMPHFVTDVVAADPVPELMCEDGLCNTAGCAAAWASTIPEANLELIDSFTLRHIPSGAEQYYAFANAFDITLEQAERICEPSEYDQNEFKIQPHHVIARIREVIAEHERTVPA